MSEQIDGEFERVTRRKLFGQMDRTDIMLTSTGVALAAFAALFPWYVFFNHDSFTINHDGMAQNLVRDLPPGPPRPVFSVSPAASINKNASSRFPGPLQNQLDDIKTATIPEAAESKSKHSADGAAMEQPLPGGIKSFRLVHVAGQRALIADQSGMYMVGIGGVLPDNSRLSSLEQRDGTWVLVTSNGDVVSMN
jgi:hypothetical protein